MGAGGFARAGLRCTGDVMRIGAHPGMGRVLGGGWRCRATEWVEEALESES